MSSIVKEGWATKMGAIFRSWKRRWFALDSNFLKYYTNSDRSKEKGSIKLSDITTVEPFTACKKPNAFTIAILNGRVFQISCDSDEELQSWLQHLKGTPEPVRPVRPMSVDDFEVLKVIGRGGFGKVQLVKQKCDEQIYAMKTMTKKQLAESNLVAATIAERDMLLKLSSPFLLSMKYTFQDDVRVYFVTPYLQGGELFEQLNAEGYFPEHRAVLYIAMIALGLQCLHENQIIHRDIKLENVLFGADGYLVITDFGLVRDVSTGGSCKTFCGSPIYLAPEIVSDQPYSFEVDWWALGVIAYEMFYGCAPFDDENICTLYHSIIKEPAPMCSDEIVLSPNAINFLEKILEKDPLTRFGHNGIVDFKQHPLFENVDWDLLARKQVEMEWTPRFRSKTDTSHFDGDVTSECPTFTYQEPAGYNIENFTAAQDETLSAYV